MISIIVCSIKPDLLKNFKANVLETIGVPHEFIIIDNNKEQFSICKAYNVGATKAKYDVLAFCHEDILFHTMDWGKELFKTLNDTDIGLIGACGAKIKPNVPAGWISVPKEFYRSNFIQSEGEKQQLNVVRDTIDDSLSDVVVVDGMFLATTKKIWDENKFDEINFDGFHFYDQDFSMQIIQKRKIVINHNILLEHLSIGSLNLDWLKYSKIFFYKWSSKLPIYINSISDKDIDRSEYNASYSYIFTSYKHKVKSAFLLKFINKMIYLKPLDRKTASVLKYFFK
ncbi:glycosyltransferase [Winogradskyella wichelsiae]|uniref:glycosyltransferase n=1 Tax=Winogradskyella wichelsiae TaxID=2697007 RepID=UPI0015C69B91|nr:glycosyltransferase [Winogradskyella wichelsiae]